MTDLLREYTGQLEALACAQGLNYFPVYFELVPTSFMMEVAVYGLPVRMPHWSFGVRYIYQLIQHRMGHSHLFEVVFPGNPGRAFMADTNSLAENTLVTAHVLGHADFSRNNALFRKSQEQVGYHIVEQAAAHARRISEAIDVHGQSRVERVLDAALALEQYIDPHLGLQRPLYSLYEEEKLQKVFDPFLQRFQALPGSEMAYDTSAERLRAPIPPHREYDLLWFIAHYAPLMDDWERDIFLAVREESFYFYPVFACQIMNEGWACLWHTTLLREGEFLPQELFLDAMKAHSDVVRPYAGEKQVALDINPYHLGFAIWSEIVKERGIDGARTIMEQDDDFSFIRNHLTEELAEQLKLFEYKKTADGEIRVMDHDIDSLRESLLVKKFNFGAPHLCVKSMQSDGTLLLRHEHETDHRGLDLVRADKVLNYVHNVWRRPVILHTVDEKGRSITRAVP